MVNSGYFSMKNFVLFFFRYILTLGYRLKLNSPTTSKNVQEHKPLKQFHSSFFIVAHPDDIELFMGREARHQILEQPETKKIFIVLSAGDANRKNKKKIFREITWWKAREQAHTLAISFWNKDRDPAIESEIMVNQRKITKITLGSAITLYNFRLTDADKITSLDDLLQQNSQAIYDLAHHQAYSKQDIQHALLELIEQENIGAQSSTFYIMDESYDRNPGDHKDHKATSEMFREVYPQISIQDKSLHGYLTYFIKDKVVNLEGEDKEVSFKTWEIIADELERNGYKRNDDPHHMQWVGKEYKSYSIETLNDKSENQSS